MGRLRSTCLAGAGLLAMARAQTIEASNMTTSDDRGVTITTSMGDNMVPLAPVLPLTAAAGQNLPPTGLSGSVFLVNATSTFYVDSRNIAAINCDAMPGELQADYLFDQVVSANASAILFYSPTSETCAFENYDGSYAWVYSMRAQSDTERLLENMELSYENEEELWAQIAQSDTIQVSGGNGSEGSSGRDLGSHAGDDANDNSNDSSLGPSPTTAVAMIILYSITGIITALFLVIIVTGALRAHRHPERYGPRNIIGRPRQSRAKGIARAMLDTLPIVKFGQREDEPKPTDVELAENGGGGQRESADAQENTTRPASDAPSQQNDSAPLSAEADPPRRQSTAEEGIAAAVTGARGDSCTPNPNNLGCSICTEDFEEGQDQRVLPCDHRFHPDCVDPWLLNVSGTCPLCRIDLHPPAEEPELDENGNPIERQTDENGTPLPLNGEPTAERQRMSVRRSLLIGLIGARSVERMSQEERLATLRHLRARRERTREANANADASATGELGLQAEQPPAGEEASRLRSRLRRVLGVRTRRTGARGQEEEQQ